MPRSTIAVLPLLVALCALPGFPLGVLEGPPRLHGTVFPQPAPAPDFTLSDQDGSPFHMADARGKVVVMSFLYTHCSDLCPYVAVKLKAARLLLGAGAARAVFVVVTTDPARDTPKVLAAYTHAVGLDGAWHFLTGPMAAVKSVWFSYGVGVDITKPAPPVAARGTGTEAADTEPSQGLSARDLDQARRVADAFGGGYEVAHSTPIWIIDRSGKIRATMDADALPSEIADNVRALAGR